MPILSLYLNLMSKSICFQCARYKIVSLGFEKFFFLQNGFCFVEFDDYRDADDACYEMNGRDLLGDRVNVEIARGTPHGRDREKWGFTRDGRGGRR